MRTLLVTLGSLGDLHPFLAIGHALAGRGEQVEVMSNAPYEEAVRAEGLEFSALCSARDHARTATHPDLWHPVRGFGVLWRHLAMPAMAPVWKRVRALQSEAPAGSWRVLASPLAVGARLAWSAEPFPLCSVYTAPANLRALQGPMVVADRRMPGWLPVLGRRAAWWVLDRTKLQPLGAPALASFAQAHAVPAPVGSIFGDWIHSPSGGVALFPASFGAPDAGWPRGVVSGDFPLYSGPDGLVVAAARSWQAFVEAGDAPAVLFAGSEAGDRRGSWARSAVETCRALGLRVIGLGAGLEGAVAPLSAQAPDDALWLPQAHLPSLLARARLFVHHGGIGSCAHGLQAGAPQVICPVAYDQFDNGLRVEAAGGGLVVWPGTHRPERLLATVESAAAWNGAVGEDIGTAASPIERRRAVAVAAIDRWWSRAARSHGSGAPTPPR